MAIYKVQTGSTGADGKPIFDVFEDQRKIELPEFQQRGLNIDQLQVGQAPTSFQSQFKPVSLNVADKIPADVLESKTTMADLTSKLQENINSQQQKATTFSTLAEPTAEEKAVQAELLGLQQAQTEDIQQTQERTLDAAVSKAGIQNEINAITSGNTRESLVNLRKQTFATQKLQQLQTQRQASFDVAKAQYSAGQDTINNLQNLITTQREIENDYLTRVNTLSDIQRKDLASVLETYKGLTWENLSPESIASIANRAKNYGYSIAEIKDGMKAVKNQIDIENAQKQQQLDTARINANKNDTTFVGEDSPLYNGLSSATATAVRAKVTAFKSEPIVQNFATIQEGYNFAKSLSNTTKNPADDQALIYSLAKALDPGSVVREGEYATAQKYAQSMVKSYGKGVEQAIAGTGFLSQDARNNIKKTIEQKYNASKKSYDNLYTQYSSGVNKLTGRKDGGGFLIDYATQQTQATNPIDPLGILGSMNSGLESNPLGI